MKKFFKATCDALYLDEYNRLTILLTVTLSVIAYLFWSKLSQAENFNFFLPYNYYPLEIFILVFVLHAIISVHSYSIDKQISRLLTSSTVFFALLIIVLEFYYWAYL